MIKKATRTDILFLAALVIVGLFLSIFLFAHPYFFDETFYATIPYRLANGDSLIQHEWHLTQFASLFSYLPVRFWLNIKGSADGMFVFLRCIYFIIHVATAVVIYLFFRKYKIWSVIASMMFFTQTPYRIFAISYNSVYVLFTLFLALCLLKIYNKPSKILYIFSGICFASACVSNPLYCLAYAFYLLICILWKKRKSFRELVISLKIRYLQKSQKNIHQKQKDKLKQIDALPEMESYGCFFSKEATIYSFIGISIVAVIAIIFYFSTGGTIFSLIENLPYLLGNSEYSVFSSSVFLKLKETIHYFNQMSFNMFIPTLLLLICILFDKKSKEMSHRYIYLILSVIIQIIFIIGMSTVVNNVYFFSLPFSYFSTVCYMLTNKKNKVLFHCVWIPCFIAAIFKYMAANALLLSLGIVFAISNIVGVFFVRDLFIEIAEASGKRYNADKVKLIKSLLCIGISMQLLMQCYVFQYQQLPTKNSVKATEGPFSHIYMTKEQYNSYSNILSDLELIKQYNTNKEPVLVISYQNWIHMYTDAPFALYTTWRDPNNNEELSDYYKINPNKKPRYIYIDYLDDNLQLNKDLADHNMMLLSELFVFSCEKLSNGLLLKVSGDKLDIPC